MYSHYITVRTQYPGFHAYENAPEKVAFLRDRHRHLFKIECTIQVFHDDRELEFFLVKDLLETQVIPFVTMRSNLGSCEQQAERICDGLRTAYGDHRYYQITVSEDGESDGVVEWEPQRS